MKRRHLVVAAAVVAICGPLGCRKKTAQVAAAVDAAPSPQLPAPFDAVRVGMSIDDLRAAFPPSEPVDKCTAQLVGGDPPLGPVAADQAAKARARCVRAAEIAGLTEAEKKRIHDQTQARRSEDEASDFERAWLYASAQVRGAIRAGQLDERVVFDAASGQSETTSGAVVPIASRLADGSRTFSKPRNNGRPICAAISDSCDDMDVPRIRRYIDGGYSLGQLDADAHARVVDGKCRGAYLRNERRLQRNFVMRTGGLAGIGLARSARGDRNLDPDKPSTYATYSVRSKLDEKTARAGVLLARAITKTEEHWGGGVALVPDSAGAHVWSSAVIWIRDGKVSRILLNVGDEAKLAQLPRDLETQYGKPAASSGTVTTWQLPENVTAKLDIGAAAALVVEVSAASTPPTAPAAAPAPSASVAP